MFKLVYTCTECHHVLSKNQVFDSVGCCPYCGYVQQSTIVSYDKHSEEYDPPSGLQIVMCAFALPVILIGGLLLISM